MMTNTLTCLFSVKQQVNECLLGALNRPPPRTRERPLSSHFR